MSEKKKHKSIVIALVAGSVGLVLIIIVGVGITLLGQHNANKEISEAQQLADKYYLATQNYSTLPSSVTKTQSQWDSYYSGLISQLKNIQQTNLQDTYTTTPLNNFKQGFGTAINDSINYLTATQSATDTSFTITADNSKIASDNNLIQTFQADGAVLMASSIVSEQATLTTDQATLKNDQQTETQENNQASQIQQTLNTDYKSLGQASHAAGFQIN